MGNNEKQKRVLDKENQYREKRPKYEITRGNDGKFAPRPRTCGKCATCQKFLKIEDSHPTNREELHFAKTSPLEGVSIVCKDCKTELRKVIRRHRQDWERMCPKDKGETFWLDPESHVSHNLFLNFICDDVYTT